MTLATTITSANISQPTQPRMTPEQFAYWLNGFAELNGGERPTPEQWKSITEHLQAVFVKVTPQYGFHVGGSGPAQAQAVTKLTTRVADQGQPIPSLIC
ncbi:hypothetical protein [Pseudomonas plecoglossicida]|jgi:hypothetical protein|uniref:hypothetical protein n=1 Tax=Pseudomonas plecoglossicida TaxID=70775 RepID=UPI00051D31D8|nr:hypothetical protein [Pseudomonas plecoglossicida]KGK25558.1 hypothetical protein GT93_12240 [Pseudomonas plecoglossicida]